VRLHGYAASAPSVSASGGTAGPVAYDRATGHFVVTVSPAAGAPVSGSGGDPVRRVTVVLGTSERGKV